MVDNTQQTQNIPTAESFLMGNYPTVVNSQYDAYLPSAVEQAMIEFAQLHCKAQREAIIKQVKINDDGFHNPTIDKASILNAYPDTLIK